VETRVVLLASTEDHAKANRRTAAIFVTRSAIVECITKGGSRCFTRQLPEPTSWPVAALPEGRSSLFQASAVSPNGKRGSPSASKEQEGRNETTSRGLE
jgi:hypothetical protein